MLLVHLKKKMEPDKKVSVNFVKKFFNLDGDHDDKYFLSV